jgi:predicted permease
MAYAVSRETGVWRTLLDSVAQDLTFALRQFQRAPLVTAGILLSLGFGIGASATVYSWMSSIVLRPLPGVHDANRLITVRPERRNGFGISTLEYEEWRGQSRTVSGLAAIGLGLFAVDANGTASSNNGEPTYGSFVSANYFDVLGVSAARGRTFTASDDVEGAVPVAVLSHTAWQTRFNADPDIVGRVIRINGQRVTVIGIAPPRFGGSMAVARFDLWIPLSTRPILLPSERTVWRLRDWRWLDVIGRLRPGTTLTQAHLEFQEIARRQAAAFPENAGRGARAIPLDIGSANQLQPLLVALVAATVLVILLICSNIANLLLTRATARERELAMRVSLGASRHRIVRQLLTESALLAVIGGLLGIGVARLGSMSVRFLLPQTSVGLNVATQMDARFVAYVLAVTGLCVMAFGLAPALFASRVQLVETLKNASGGSSRRGSGMRDSLVVAQFVLALSVLVCTAVMLRRDRDVHSMDLGFRKGDHVLLMQTEMSLAGYGDPRLWRESIERVRDNVGQIRGVRSVALGSFAPLGLIGYFRRAVVVPGRPVDPGATDRVLVNGVDSGYFNLMGIEILEGRGFNAADMPDSPAVVVVNRAFAGQYLGAQSPLGQSFTLGGRTVTIVGVVQNGRYDYREIDNATMPMVYFPWGQSPTGLVSLHVRVDGDPAQFIRVVSTAIRETDPSIALLPPVTLLQNASVPFSIARSSLKVLSVLGTAALILASMGLFSVLSYSVSLRTREIGIRLAVGATQRRVIRLVLGGAVRLTAFGLALGIPTAIGLAGLLRSRVPVLPSPLTEFALPVFVLISSALLAGLIPARRAALVDPSRTLRTE